MIPLIFGEEFIDSNDLVVYLLVSSSFTGVTVVLEEILKAKETVKYIYYAKLSYILCLLPVALIGGDILINVVYVIILASITSFIVVSLKVNNLFAINYTNYFGAPIRYIINRFI
jgi:O-antigen/teichoic acid export membrane protein